MVSKHNPNKYEISVTNLFCKISVYMCIYTHTHTHTHTYERENFIHTCTLYRKDRYRKA